MAIKQRQSGNYIVIPFFLNWETTRLRKVDNFFSIFFPFLKWVQDALTHMRISKCFCGKSIVVFLFVQLKLWACPNDISDEAGFVKERQSRLLEGASTGSCPRVTEKKALTF